MTLEPGSVSSDVAVVISEVKRPGGPDRQFNSTGAVYQYFGDSLPSTTGLSRVTEKDDHWLDCGRDPAMEDYLLRAILKRCPAQIASTAEAPSGS